MNFILRGLYHEEEWRCAWEACRDFVENNKDYFGRRMQAHYTFEGPSGEIVITVWRSQRGIEVIREKLEQGEEAHEHK